MLILAEKDWPRKGPAIPDPNHEMVIAVRTEGLDSFINHMDVRLLGEFRAKTLAHMTAACQGQEAARVVRAHLQGKLNVTQLKSVRLYVGPDEALMYGDASVLYWVHVTGSRRMIMRCREVMEES